MTALTVLHDNLRVFCHKKALTRYQLLSIFRVVSIFFKRVVRESEILLPRVFFVFGPSFFIPCLCIWRAVRVVAGASRLRRFLCLFGSGVMKKAEPARRRSTAARSRRARHARNEKSASGQSHRVRYVRSRVSTRRTTTALRLPVQQGRVNDPQSFARHVSKARSDEPSGNTVWPDAEYDRRIPCLATAPCAGMT